VKQKKVKDSTEAFDRVLRKPLKQKYVLRLYITGMTPRSTQAIQNIKKICDTELHDRYDLEVIDIYQRPVLTEGEQIIATPMLIKKLPLPIRRFVGDMSDTERIVLGLDLKSKK
jgi:circadian clock protein KaiB